MDVQPIIKCAKPGDLIKVFRPERYYHWMVYIGDGEVVHLTSRGNGDDSSSSLALSSSSISGSCGSGVCKIAVVKRQKLQEVTHGDPCEIDNLRDKEYKPRNPQEIVANAIAWVGSTVEYSVFRQNCEHFVTMLRYLKPESKQAEDAVTGLAVVTGGIALITGVVALFKLFKSNNEEKEKKQEEEP